MNLPKYLKSPKNRIIIILFLLTVLSGLCFYYNLNFEANSEYPSTSSILANYPQGETVYVSGSLVGTYNGGFYINDNFYSQNVIYKVNSTYKVEDGDIISVVGTLGPSFTITPQKIVINKHWKEDFLLYRSGICLIILLLIFWRYWKFDLKNMEFIRRE